MGNNGLLGLQVPKQYKGLELTTQDTMRIMQQVGAIDTTVSLFVGLSNILGIRPIVKYAKPEVKEAFLPILATGRELSSFGLTEEGAGSNPLAITTKAECVGEKLWSINGKKIWIGAASWAGFVNVFAREYLPNGTPKGITSYLIRQGSKGLRQGEEALTTGMRGMIQNSVYLEDVLVGEENILGVSGKGMEVAQDAMMYGRLAIAACSLGGIKRCLQLIHRYVTRRTISTGKHFDNAITLLKMNEIAIMATCLEKLVTKTSSLIDKEDFNSIELFTIAKIVAPEFFWKASDHLIQILGGRGYIENNIAPQIMRDARVLRIFEGPTETISMYLGSRIVHKNEEIEYLLVNKFKAPNIYDKLSEAIEMVSTLKNTAFSETQNHQVNYLLISEFACLAVLEAILVQEVFTNNAEPVKRAITWVQESFKAKLAHLANQKTNSFEGEKQKELQELILSYQESIGDLEQTLVGEDRELDTLLRKELYKPSEIIKTKVVENNTFTPENTESFEEIVLTNDKVTEDLGDVQGYLIKWLAEELETSIENIDANTAFAEYGLDSVTSIRLVGEIEKQFKIPLSETIIWDYPNIKSLSKYIKESFAGLSTSKLSVKNIEKITIVEKKEPALNKVALATSPNVGLENKAEPVLNKVALAPCPDNEEIAIIGVSCRYPKDIEDTDDFWNFLENKIDNLEKIPNSRFNINEYYSSNPQALNKIHTKYGYFIDKVDEFNPKFFGINDNEAKNMDPQQRLLLENTWRALESSGINPETLNGTNTGVFLGISANEYRKYNIYSGNTELIGLYSGTGSAINIASGRLSYFFGFEGPNMVVDTACSSGLTSVYLACQSLQNNECTLAVSGSVNVILDPEPTIYLSNVRALAPDGKCKTFDTSADGFARAEGCGIIILKRLSDAIKDNDNILAVIKSSAINQDGKSNGLTAPNPKAQKKVIEKALAKANLKPKDISYLETHGTGTNLGDPIEVNTLVDIFEPNREKDNFLLLGAVKTNIGHTESVSGITSLIKVLLALKNKKIPSNLHFKELNSKINLKNLPAVFPNETISWLPKHKRRIAGISSFGLSGTNVHTILEEFYSNTKETNSENISHIFTLSAKEDIELTKTLAKYINYLEKTKDNIADICYTSNISRTIFNKRLAIVAKNTTELKNKIIAYNKTTFSTNNYKNVFVFTGQGAQYCNMAKQLYETNYIFKTTIDTCSKILEKNLDKSLIELIYSEEHQELLNETQYTQVCLFSMEYALAKLWLSLGVTPEYVLGHSIGEYVAACLAEIFTLEEGLKIVAKRGELMQKLPKNGSMVSVLAKYETVIDFIKDYPNTVSIAAINTNNSVVISGLTKDINKVVEKLTESDLKTTYLKVSHAFHSPLMNDMLAEFKTFLTKIDLKPSKIKLVSNLDGQIKELGWQTTPEYWSEHILKSVSFLASIQNFDKVNFIELGPNPILTTFIKTISAKKDIHTFYSLKENQESWQTFLENLGALYSLGQEITWGNLHLEKARKKVALPVYQWERTSYWIEDVKKAKPIIKKTTLNEKIIKNTLFNLEWQKEELNISKTLLSQNTKWVIFVPTAMKKSLEEFLEKEKQNYIFISCDLLEKDDKNTIKLNTYDLDSFSNLLNDIFQKNGLLFYEFIYLWQIEKLDTINNDNYQKYVTFNTNCLLNIIKVLNNTNSNLPKRISIVTQESHTIDNNPSKKGLYQSFLNGFVRNMIEELPEMMNRFIDLPFNYTETDLSNMFRSISMKDTEKEIIIRGNTEYYPRIKPLVVGNLAKKEPIFSNEDTYLITGGMGGIAYSILPWLAEKGIKQVILLGRNEPSSELENLFKELELHIITKKVDIASKIELKSVLLELKTEFKHINGIINLAGVINDKPLLTQVENDFETTFNAKVYGLNNLFDTLEELDLKPDLFINFSSIASIIGNRSQANYASANAYQDYFSAFANKLGFTFYNINWSLWNEVGMVNKLSESSKKTIESIGIILLEQEKALNILDYILLNDIKISIALEIDLTKGKNYFSKNPKFDYLFATLPQILASSKKELRINTENLNYEKWLVDWLAEKLMKEPSEFDLTKTLPESGVYSLLAFELQNDISTLVNKEILITEAFSKMTLKEVAEYIATEVENNKPKIDTNKDSKSKFFGKIKNIFK